MKKKLTSIILFILITVIATNIYASITANASLTSSKTKVKPGEEFTVKLKISEINAGDGLNGVQLKIDYNRDIFETLGESAVKGLNGLTAYYNESDEGNILVATTMSGIKDNKEFIEATFKVKENAANGNALIAFNEIEIFNLEKTNIGGQSINIEIVNEEEEATPTPTTKPTATPDGGSESTPTPSTKPNITPTPTATAKPNNGENKNDVPITNIDTNTSSGSSSTNKGNTSSGSSSNKGSTTSSSSLPKAGIGSTITVLTVMTSIIGAVAYIKLRNYREI